MGNSKVSKEDKARAYDFIKGYKGKQIYANVKSVSSYGMSRRIEFYCVDDDGRIDRIGFYMAKIIDYPYNVDKGGISVSGCGMDMIFHVISCFNYAVAQYETGKSLRELLDSGKYGRIYDDYFFDADKYRTL